MDDAYCTEYSGATGLAESIVSAYILAVVFCPDATSSHAYLVPGAQTLLQIPCFCRGHSCTGTLSDF